MLQWKRRKDGSLYTDVGKVRYEITEVENDVRNLGAVELKSVLRRNGELIFRTHTTAYCASPEFDRSVKAGIAACKAIANKIADGTGSMPLYTQVMKTLKGKDKAVEREYLELCCKILYEPYVRFLPEMPGPKKSLFLKVAREEGLRPQLVPSERLKKWGITRKDITEDYLTTLSLLTIPLVKRFEWDRTVEWFRKTGRWPQSLTGEFSPNTGNCPKKIAPDRKTEVELRYRGSAPEERDTGEMRKVFSPTKTDPLPFIPKSAKFDDLYQWGEKIRDYFQVRRKFATVEYLRHALTYSCGWSYDRGELAVKKLELIYSQEAKQEKARLKAICLAADDHKPEEKEVKTAKGKDRWGYRLSSKAATVNAVITKVPKTVKRLERESGRKAITTHLNELVRRKLVKRLEDGKYRLRKPKKQGI